MTRTSPAAAAQLLVVSCAASSASRYRLATCVSKTSCQKPIAFQTRPQIGQQNAHETVSKVMFHDVSTGNRFSRSFGRSPARQANPLSPSENPLLDKDPNLTAISNTPISAKLSRAFSGSSTGLGWPSGGDSRKASHFLAVAANRRHGFEARELKDALQADWTSLDLMRSDIAISSRARNEEIRKALCKQMVYK